MISPLVYPTCSGTSVELPFERFLPIEPLGMVSCWLHRESLPGSTILDPLGASPRAILEAAASGYQVLVACNNPVIDFELRMLASAPDADEFNAVIRELGDQKKGQERLEDSILSLYQTRCATCGELVQASGFLWKHGESLPHARFYDCPQCGDSGEHQITDEDIQRLQQIQRSEPMYRSLALARVMGGSVDDRDTVTSAIQIYPVRALYVLFTLINKMEGMTLTQRKRDLLNALLLSLLDAGNAIWSWPEQRERPKLLSVPSQFIEKNLWLELDHAIQTWNVKIPRVEYSSWPKLPTGNGFCLYPGRMRDLAQAAAGMKIDHILCVFPRPNQAFWTLCSLWSSWLWGQDLAGRFSQVIERRRFDWYWHTTALHAALLPSTLLAGVDIPVLGILPEPAAGLVNAVVESASISRWEISACAVKGESEPVLVEWRTAAPNQDFKPINVQKAAREAMRNVLNETGEPREYLLLHTAAMAALAEEHAFPPSIQQLTYEKALEIQASLNTILADTDFLRRMDATAQEPDSGLWWLVQPEADLAPAADRFEDQLVTWFQKERSIPAESLHERINQRFPGYLTPADDLVSQCLDSYATLDENAQTWTLKDAETFTAREVDKMEILELLKKLSLKLKMSQASEHPVLWTLQPGLSSPAYKFQISNTAIIEREVLLENTEGGETIFLLPGSRSGLLKFKINRNPYLRELLSSNFHFLKYRTLRSIAAREDLSLEIWKALIDSDPLSQEETTQLSMFR